MKVIIPMAGRGSRFLVAIDQNPDYANPKPFIKIKGKPMICWAVESLPFINLPHRPAKTKFTVQPEDLIFICRKDQDGSFGVSTKLRELFGNGINVVLIDHVTRGAAETVLFAKKLVPPYEEVIVSDSDHYFDGNYLYQKIINKEKDVAGIIPIWTPQDNEPKWSYSLVEPDGTISAVGEKSKALAELGAPANIGAYYFRHWHLFTEAVDGAIRENDMTGDEGKKEFYVAPTYHRLIKQGLKIIPAPTPQVWGLGTPKDVAIFEKVTLIP